MGPQWKNYKRIVIHNVTRFRAFRSVRLRFLRQLLPVGLLFFVHSALDAQVTPPVPVPFPGDTTKFPQVPNPQDTAEARRRGLSPFGRKLADSLGLRRDSLGLGSDTTFAVDTTWVVYLDSTARMAQFKHYRDRKSVV
jgi:hypothetical protein